MDIHEKSVDMDMDNMDNKFHIYGKPGDTSQHSKTAFT